MSDDEQLSPLSGIKLQIRKLLHSMYKENATKLKIAISSFISEALKDTSDSEVYFYPKKLLKYRSNLILH